MNAGREEKRARKKAERQPEDERKEHKARVKETAWARGHKWGGFS